MIYTFSPFGYEGSLVDVEIDLRHGIPSVDIVGLADSLVKESRERLRSAFENSGFEFPTERVLISLSPADLRKDSSMDLAMAVAILEAQGKIKLPDNVLVLGELELSGKVRPVRGVHAALDEAKSSGIQYAITPAFTEKIDGIKILQIENLKEIESLAQRENNYKKNQFHVGNNDEVTFSDIDTTLTRIENIKVSNKAKFATMVAVAGHHHILYIGGPGCEKASLAQTIPNITPDMTIDESRTVTRIHSLAGLLKPTEDFIKQRPFRMPHQTASIEGICGGGSNCRPGEISLAHNGVLFLDEAAEFKSSVLQMLRVPLESHLMTLSRAGRTTRYPANFQLVMTTNPCPCGNYGNNDKICLCSARSVRMYWNKFSAPLIYRIGIRVRVEQSDEVSELTTDEMRKRIAVATKIQRERGVYNQDLNPSELTGFINSLSDANEERPDPFSQREISNIVKIAVTIANLDGRKDIEDKDIVKATDLMEQIPF